MKCEKRIWGLLGPLGPELLLMKSQPFKAGGKEKQLGRTWKNHHKLFLLFLVSCLFVLTQLLSWVTTKEFRVFGPSDPIVAAPGGEAILPCSVFPAMNVENMEELRWFRSRFSEAVLVYRDQKEQKREQMPGYSRRTLLVKDKFHQGTVAVRIQNVQASDSGLYICHFKQGVFYEEAILELKVAAMGSVPEVRIKGPEDGGVSVVCNTSGWYPKPQVHWRDFRGENLTASSEIHHEDAQGLFSTETSLVVRDSSVRSVTCSIFNPILGQEKAMAIFIPGAVMVELARRQAGYRAAWRKAQLYADWRKEHFQAWTFTLDPASAHANLAISQDRLSVTRNDSTLCLEDLSSGVRHRRHL
uniref:Butyrophilin-like 5 n=1 Tax=Mus musculus TaxID=10090 RepID=A2CG21_MOUSE|nr:butyrophilin-like 5 [Mus musculus]